MYLLLCSIMGCFFCPMRSRMLPVMRSKMGCAASEGGKSYFYSVSWVSTGQQLAQRASRICSVVPGHHAENEASSNRKSGLWHFHLHPQLRRVWGLRLSVAGGHAQNCGENGFFTLPVPKLQWKGPKAGTSKNGQIYLCWRAPPHFVRFVGAPGFRQKRVFENRAIFAETTENVVPNGRGSKTHFCTVGFEIGHLTSASNIVPKYFSLNWHFLSHSPSRRQAELFYFSCLFPFLRTGPFLYFSWLHFSATTSAICPFCCVSFLLFVLVVFVFLLVSLLLILLRHSFLSLDFCFLVFFCPVLFLFFFAFHVFFLPVVCLILLLFFCPSLMFLSVTRPYLVLMFPFVLCFLLVSRLILFALCFFSLFLLFLIFCLFFSPGPCVRLRRTTMDRTTISFCLPFGDLCENVLCAHLLCIYFLVDFFLFTEHVFVRYSWNMFWGSKGLLVVVSYLLLYRCFGVWCRAVFLSNLSLVPTFLGIRSVLCSCFFYFGCFCFFRVLLRSIFFGFVYLPHLGLVLLRCCVVVLVFYLYVLAGCLCVSVSVLSFCGEPCGGGLWAGSTRRGQYIFCSFS